MIFARGSAFRFCLFGVLLLVQAGCSDSSVHVASAAATEGAIEFRMDAWADNWFVAFNGETLLVEDSVPITTERSFNAETVQFRADYPLQLNFVLKDFKENDSGLEYIGTPRQQMGDGGFIMQLTDLRNNRVVAVSDANWVCSVIQSAPLDEACRGEANPVAGVAPCTFIERPKPDGWKRPDFDDDRWPAATVHSRAAVGPKGGYDGISWDPEAKFIWGPDLKKDNTVLCRVTVVEKN